MCRATVTCQVRSIDTAVHLSQLNPLYHRTHPPPPPPPPVSTHNTVLGIRVCCVDWDSHVHVHVAVAVAAAAAVVGVVVAIHVIAVMAMWMWLWMWMSLHHASHARVYVVDIAVQTYDMLWDAMNACRRYVRNQNGVD